MIALRAHVPLRLACCCVAERPRVLRAFSSAAILELEDNNAGGRAAALAGHYTTAAVAVAVAPTTTASASVWHAVLGCNERVDCSIISP